MNEQYSKFCKTWRKMRDVFEGSEHMKNRALEQNMSNVSSSACNQTLVPIKTFGLYLRPKNSMRVRSDGLAMFCDYIDRAKYFPFPLETQEQSLGLIENEPAVIDLPAQMEFMLTDATNKHESLEKVLSIGYTQQLQVSRIGSLLEPSADSSKPYNIALYKTEAIVDWNEVIDSVGEMQLNWLKLLTDEVDAEDKPIYLILTLDESGVYYQYKTTDGDFKYGKNDSGYIKDSDVTPKVKETTLGMIPFVITNVTRLGTEIERPYLESIADSSIDTFKASALYQDALYHGGESSMFTKGFGLGEEGRIYTGNGAVNTTNEEYADAKIVTLGTEGIGPREKDLENNKSDCVALGVDLITQGTESGTALIIRTNVKTASLKTLALTGALGLQRLLKIGAEWLGLNKDDVSVTANTVFSETKYTAEDLTKFSAMIGMGTLREVDMYNLQKKQNITTAETFEIWENDLEKEDMSGDSL